MSMSFTWSNAELALAAYATLQPGTTGNQLGALVNEGRGLSLKQAQEFARRYPEVIAQVDDAATGFSMTVFRDSSGGVAVAMRGTDQLLDDWLPTNTNIAISGAGYQQIVSMYNAWQRLTHPQGAPITVYRIGAVNPAISLVAEQIVNDLGSPSTPLIAMSQLVYVTGHSLGGHLAMSFAGLFPDNTIEVLAFNAPGFKDSTQNQEFFLALGGLLPIGEAPGGVPITNVIADALPGPGHSTVLPAGMHSRPGVPVDIAIENQAPPTDEPDPPFTSLNHSQQILTDSLAVLQLLVRFAPSLTASSFAVLLDSAAHGTAGGLEKVMDALRQTVGMNAVPLSVGNAHREALYHAIYETQANASYVGLQGSASLRVLAESDAATLAKQAKQDFGYFLALSHLLPFALEGAGSPLVDAHAELQARWNADRSKRISSATDLEFSDAYIADRAQMLAFLMQGNTNDTNVFGSDQVADQVLYRDLALRPVAGSSTGKPTEVNVFLTGGTPNQRGPNTRVIGFGTDGAEALQGRDNADRLYGGLGADLLTGGKGDDYLEGGAGIDLYLYGGARSVLGQLTNDGDDEILDTDGKGVIRYAFAEGGLFSDSMRTSVIGGVGVHVADTEWRSPDGKFTYTASSEGLLVTINGDAGGSIFIRDFDVAQASDTGYLGIRLVEAPVSPVAPQTSREIFGDRELLVSTASVPAIFVEFTTPDGTIGHDWVPQTEPHWTQLEVLETYRDSSGTPIAFDIRYKQFDDLDNLVRSSAPSPGFKDAFLDGSGNDHIVTGDGADTVTATRGGDDQIEVGEGFDEVWAGPGNDWVEGGPGDDMLLGEAGNDFVSGGVHRDRVLGGDGGDWLEGEADGDIVAGGEGNDVIFGGTGRDPSGQAVPLAFLLVNSQSASSSPDKGDLLDGGAGSDLIVGASTTDLIAAGQGNDIVLGGAGDDTIYGDASIPSASLGWFVQRDVRTFGSSRVYEVLHSFDTVFVDDPAVGGADVIYGGAGQDWIFGGAGNDYLDGGDSPGDANVVDDVLFGEAGSDILFGGSGNDFLSGDSSLADESGLSGDDYLMGGAGDDELLGGHGNDILDGGTGDDILSGGEGDDLLWGGTGLDTLAGGSGKDTYIFHRGDGVENVYDVPQGGAADASVVVLGDGIARSQATFRVQSLMIDLGDGDALHFQGFDPGDPYATQVVGAIQFADGDYMSFEDILAQGFVVEGTSDDDHIVGTSLRELIDAGAGNDIVESRGGNDDIAGGDGEDFLDGGAGNDVLAGGAGSDAYLIRGRMGTDTITDGESGESNVLLLGAGVTLQGLAPQRVDDSLVLTLRGTSDSVTITDYYARSQSWIVRDLVGTETSLDAVLAQPDPHGGDFIASLWGDFKLGATAQLMARGYEIGWKALDQDTFEMFQESAHLQYASQTTTESITRAEAPFDILSRNITVETQETLLNFGQRAGSTFHWAQQSFETARLESDEPEITGSLGAQPIVETPGQAVLTLRREGPVLGEQHTAWSNFGGVISYQSGTETVFANVRYDYDLHSYRQSARVTNVSPGAGTWQLPADTVAGNSVLVDMQRVERRHLGLLEIIGGDSANVIDATVAASPFETTLLVDAGAGDDLVLNGDLVFGNDGNDDLRGSALLIGGNGDDRLEGSRNARFVFTSSEVGIDTVVAPWTSAAEYVDWYYDGVDIPDWSERLNEGGRYAAFVLADGESLELQYFDTLEEAEGEGGTDIRHIEPLDHFAPALRRDDTATLEAFAAAGGLSRDVALFGPGIALEDLELTITVNGGASLAHPGRPWNAGGRLSVRWNGGLAGFDVDVPDLNYGFTGTNLVLDGLEDYRVGEGIEAFEFVDGGRYGLEDILARATVALDFGYRFQRGFGSQVVEPHWGGVDFAGDIAPAEVSAYRDGGDLVLVLADGSAQAVIAGWYADPTAFTSWFLHFADGTLFDAGAMNVLGVTRKGTEGADVLVGDPALPGFLFGYGGDDTLIGGAGDDYLDGGEGNDTYVFHAGSGADVIVDPDPSIVVFGEDVPSWSVNFGLGSLLLRYGDGDSIRFMAFDADDPQATRVFERLEFADGSALSYEDFLNAGLSLSGSEEDEVITGTGIRDVIFGYGGNDTLHGGGGNDDLHGGEGDDTLWGERGDNDSLAGDEGADTYVFAPGDGRDDVYEWDETPGVEDRVLLQGFEVADVQVTRNPWSYYLAMDGGDRLTLANMAIEPAAVVERIEFADGTVWTSAELEARVELLPGTGGDDVLWGTDGADTIHGLGGDDELYGNAGDDFLTGGEGGDFYYFAAGDGHDTVDNYDTDAGYDSIYFAGASSTDVTLSREGANLVITVGTDSVALADWYHGADYRIDVIHFEADGGYWDAATIESLAPATGGNSAPVVANPLQDVSYEAGADFAFVVPAGTFLDPDVGDSLGLAATRFDGSPLPSWLSFDPTTALFTGTPAATDFGISHILVTATDGSGAAAHSDFGLVVRVPAGAEATGSAGDDVIYGGTGDETLTAKGGSDYLYGDLGNDLLKGGGGNDVLQGGAGNDVLRGGKGQNVLDGGAGDDLIFGGQGSAFIVGGAGNDTLRVGSGSDVIAFNAGDGMDTIYGGRDGGNTLSFGGGIRYSDLSLSKEGKDLVVSTGAGEGVTLKNWYAGNHSVLNLQIVLDATEDFDAASTDPLYNRRVQTFDFLGMVSAFDAARVETPGLTSWEITNALLAFHLSGADDMALGGDLAYWYGKNRTLAGVSLQSAQQVIGTANFGSEAQSLRPFNGLQEGFVKLA